MTAGKDESAQRTVENAKAQLKSICEQSFDQQLGFLALALATLTRKFSLATGRKF